MTKTIFTFLLTSLFAISVLAQTPKEEIKNTFEVYFKTVQEKDNAKTLEYIYPRLFDHFPKDRMLMAMDQMKADTSILITMGNGTVKNISEILEAEGKKYVLIKYAFRMTMVIKKGSDESEDEDDESNPAAETYEMLKETYGDDNVEYDPENNKLDINVTNQMYAIADPKYTGWKFLEKKENMQPILDKLLPKTVLKKL